MGSPKRLPALLSFCMSFPTFFINKMHVATATSSTPTSSTSCTTEWIGDGLCNLSNNSDDCDYDGGDCCSCTCTDGTYECGAVGFLCVDPGASCYPSCHVFEYGNGFCTAANNVLDCNYDGGDCCPCTCVDDTYECGANGYDCQDPSAGCTTSTSTSGTTTSTSCTTEWIGDGWCDLPNNSDDCDYDGGDCCSCTCTDDTYECGAAGFLCVDPDASCYPSCHVFVYGDGSCTATNNVLDCNYDGGDCCPCTCVDHTYECGANGYDCQDPSAGCTTSTSTSGPTISTSCTTEWIGDGVCDLPNNSDDCDYDGGDCCSCTCTDGTYECGVVGFLCVDPGASCYPSCHVSEYGDGSCTATNNVLDCNYDGGDCCPCTCLDHNYECGANGYDCQDPSAGCTTSTSLSDPTPQPTPTPTMLSTPQETPSSGESKSTPASDGDGDSVSVAIIWGIVAVGVVAFAATVACVYFYRKSRGVQPTPNPEPLPPSTFEHSPQGGVVYIQHAQHVPHLQHTSEPSAPPLPEGSTARPPQPMPSYNHLYDGQ